MRVRKHNLPRIRERPKIFKEVFDKSTVDTVWKLIRQGQLDGLDYIISTGKEANVFRVTRKGKSRACKVYRYETTTFTTMQQYIQGDPRFEDVKNNTRELVNAWCRKEFKNLELARKAGCNVPKPYAFLNNVLLMEFLGDKEAAPLLKDIKVDDYDNAFWKLADEMKKLYKAGLVHADLSEYNVIIWKGQTWMIDIGQGVLLSHPRALELLERDARNVTIYFNDKGVKVSEQELLKHVKS